MPRMQVYLPNDLYEQVKSRRLSASELLQKAVRAEVRRQDVQAEADTYLAKLIAESTVALCHPCTRLEHGHSDALPARW
jgi:hypothetical protein